MAFGAALKTNGVNSTDNNAQSTAAFTPAAGTVLYVVAIIADTGGAELPAISGMGATWSLTGLDQTGVSTQRMIGWTGIGHAASLDTVDFSTTGNQENWQWFVWEITDCDTSNPIVQLKEYDALGSVTTPAITMDSAPTSGVSIGVMARNLSGTTGWGLETTNWTATAQGAATPSMSSNSAANTTNDQSWSNSVAASSARYFGGLTEFREAGTSATATPGVIATTTALPAATLQAGATASPAAVATVTALPAAQARAGSTLTPAAIASVVAMPAAVTQAGSTTSPAAIAAVTALPAATPSAGSTTTPAAIASVVALPQASASGGGAGTAMPAAIAATVALPAATPQAGSTTSPGVLAAVVALPAASTSGGGTASPAAIAALAALPAASASAGSTVLAALIQATVALPQASTSAGATASPAVIALLVALPAALATGSPVLLLELVVASVGPDRTITTRRADSTVSSSAAGNVVTTRSRA